MAPPDPHHRTQEQSIKARKHQLFGSDEDDQTGPRRSFAACLRETPAAPLPLAIRAALWAVGALVILLLLAAFAKVGTKKPRPKPTSTACLAPRDFRAGPIAA